MLAQQISLRCPRKVNHHQTSPAATHRRLVFPTGPADAALLELKTMEAQAEHGGKPAFTNIQLQQISVQRICWENIERLGNTATPQHIRKAAERVLVNHKAEIISFGDLAYEMIEPVLKTIDSAPQLKIIEQNSPQIRDADHLIWQKLIAKDFGMGALSKIKVKDDSRWSVLYDTCREERAEENDRIARSMKMIMQATEAERKTTTVTHLKSSSVIPAARGRTKGEGWGARNHWDAKVGAKVKDIVKKSKVEAHQVALRNRSAETPVFRSDIDSSMADVLRMRHQQRLQLTTNTSKKRPQRDDPPLRGGLPKKARTSRS
ncbi:hypothetical protein BZA77DRAFT_298345 [Pyronema omphalodes]|nr:hypothetical protein BZA77DRAFT_298345 [Pyronema omphalodes]